MKQYKGILIEINTIKEKYPQVMADIDEGKCECKPTGYSDFGPIWFICPYHTGYCRAIKEIQLCEYYGIE
jgi:hypothetical protein